MAIDTIQPTYQEGQFVKVRLGALNGEDLFEEGVIAEVTHEAPLNRSRLLGPSDYWYRLNGHDTYCRQDAIIPTTHQRLIA